MDNNYEVKFTILDNPAPNREVIAVEPLERGYGNTLGHALRRVMLSYLYGAAVTKVKVNNVPHEFSPLKGVREDVVELIQNIKGINFNMTMPKVHIVTLQVSGEQEVRAKDIKCPTGLEITNPDHYIATLSDKKSKLNVELTVEYGQGYKLPEDRDKRAIGTILVDANFSPVSLVSYKVENTRIGRSSNLDRLVMDVTTDGSMSPTEAIKKAAADLFHKFNFIAGDEIKVTHIGDEVEQEIETPRQQNNQSKIYLEELNLPTRVLNTIKRAGYETVDDMKDLKEEDLNKIKNIGPKTVEMILEKVKAAHAAAGGENEE